jgi:hypothetical protein
LSTKFFDNLFGAIRRGDSDAVEKAVRNMAEDERKTEAVEKALKTCHGYQGSKYWTCIAEILKAEDKGQSQLIKTQVTPSAEQTSP